jgi:hypothetical protein
VSVRGHLSRESHHQAEGSGRQGYGAGQQPLERHGLSGVLRSHLLIPRSRKRSNREAHAICAPLSL